MRTTKALLKDLRKYDPEQKEILGLKIKMKEKRLTKAQKKAIHEAKLKEVGEMESKFGGRDYYSSSINPSKAYEMATQGY